MPNFIVKHWHGGYSLGISFWVFGVLLNGALNLISRMIETNVAEKTFSTSEAIFACAILVLLFTITVWQLCGVWKAAENHQSRTGKVFWATAAQLWTGFGFFGLFLSILAIII